jgi:STE24 endopeptidase
MPRHRLSADEIAVYFPDLDLARAKRYSRTRLILFGLSATASIGRLAWFALSGRSDAVRGGVSSRVGDERLVVPGYVAVVTLLNWAASLPLAFFGSHRIEQRYGLTKQSDRAWFGEQVKGAVVATAIQVPLVSAAYVVIRRRPRDWWLVLAGATVPLVVAMSNLAPVVLMPLFNRFEPVRDRALADRITGLAERAGVSIAEIFTMDMSRQSEKPNAFFTGLGRTKRIVLGDTLVDRFEPAEVDGVIAHELGHQVHGDVWRFVALTGGVGFAAAYALHRVAPPLLLRTSDRTGVEEIADPAGLPILALVGSLIGAVTTPLFGAVSRRIERRTDRYALTLTGDGKTYASALARLASRSLSDPLPPAAAVFLLYSHPPIGERIAAALAYQAEVEAGSAVNT